MYYLIRNGLKLSDLRSSSPLLIALERRPPAISGYREKWRSSSPKRLYHARLYSRLPRRFAMPHRVKTNPDLQRVIDELKALSREHDAPIWRAAAGRPERARKNWAEGKPSRRG